ncbi:hypothetical protein OEB99_13985 [Actinotalea sp. M2MS4P-6]|uniref:hypothetical protein n=1 Tax=Actinotalea sp. M2MS4P-6 TaxID=2983762 RepID=UPI0021E48FA1|nr:hypothetical protein [Actinotalea sp. M2MS4P-6]MCV2395422.1 hypothetical protein [Actinotalea sp. M2MS4P-6]
MSLSRPVAGLVLACSALALAGCSGTPAASPSTAGPLEAFFADAMGSYDEEAANRDAMQVEELVAQCMAEQGFEYTPVDQSQGISYSSDDLDVEWGTLEFAEQYGYAITTDPWGTMTEESPEEAQEWVDPNEDYVAAMSETEQQAYYTALYGDQSQYEEVEDGEEIEYNWEDNGCQGAAQHEVYEGGDAVDSDQFQALWDDMDAMWQAVQDDPRMAEAVAGWASCMADAGYPGMASFDDPQNQISDQVNALWDDAYADLDPETATEDDWAAVEDQVQGEQAALTDTEIAMATADYTCRDDADVTSLQTEVQNEYEQEFVDSHRDALEAYKATMTEQTS